MVIGAGISGLAAACYLAQAGYEVEVYEKNRQAGGRARQLRRDGFVFDMGPTFYWMPDVFERFFADFGKRPADYYELVRLDPGYEVCFGPHERIPVAADVRETEAVFESREKGSGPALHRFLAEGAFNYRVAMDRVVYKPGRSPWELVLPETAARAPQFFMSLSSKVRRTVRDAKLASVLEFPVLFLGAKPSDIPSFYSFMDYAGIVEGTWHVRGGMGKLTDALVRLCGELGVRIRLGVPVEGIVVEKNNARGIVTREGCVPVDGVISGADYRHTETLLPDLYRNYRESYWRKRVMAPSALLYYVALDKKLEGAAHHTLFFDTDFQEHAAEIYDRPAWPSEPLFYASFPTVTDPTMAPPGKEAAVFLIPVAAGLRDTSSQRQRYLDAVLTRTEAVMGVRLRDHILFAQSYAPSDFVRDYHAWLGNAYGLANTLLQTAFMKPKIFNRKVNNLFYTGQLTVPGPGVPPALISGKIAAREMIRTMP